MIFTYKKGLLNWHSTLLSLAKMPVKDTVLCGAIVLINSHHNRLPWNIIKLYVHLTPVSMLFLLLSVPDQAVVLAKLYFIAIVNLFDGIEMLLVLSDDINQILPVWIHITIWITTTMFFHASYVEISQIKVDENETLPTLTTCTQTVKNNETFQLWLNVLFLLLRLVLWLNAFVLFMQALPYLQRFGWI